MAPIWAPFLIIELDFLTIIGQFKTFGQNPVHLLMQADIMANMNQQSSLSSYPTREGYRIID